MLVPHSLLAAHVRCPQTAPPVGTIKCLCSIAVMVVLFCVIEIGHGHFLSD